MDKSMMLAEVCIELLELIEATKGRMVARVARDYADRVRSYPSEAQAVVPFIERHTGYTFSGRA